jgi:hypothetical protein
MVYDAEWPFHTPFHEALGPLKNHLSFETSIIMLRTCKSDVIVGLNPEQDKTLFDIDPDWLINGKWGIVQYYCKQEDLE